MRVLLGLGDVQLARPGLRDHLGQRHLRDMRRERHRVVPALAVLGEGHQADPGHDPAGELVEVRLAERPGQLTGSIRAEVEVEHHVPVRHPVVVADHGRLDELVRFVPLIRLRHGCLGRRRVAALGVDDRVVCPLDPIPPAVAIHGVVAPTDRGDPPGVLEPPLELGEVAGSGPGLCVAPVGEGVDDEVRHALARRELDARLDVLPAGVDAAVGDQSHEVKPAAGAVARRLARRPEDRVVEEAAVGDRVVDAGQVLLDDGSGTEVEVADLRVPHLAVGQADVAAAGREHAVRKPIPQLVEDWRRRLADRVPRPRWRQAPAVQHNQGERRDRDLARPRRAASPAGRRNGGEVARVEAGAARRARRRSRRRRAPPPRSPA